MSIGRDGRTGLLGGFVRDVILFFAVALSFGVFGS